MVIYLASSEEERAWNLLVVCGPTYIVRKFFRNFENFVSKFHLTIFQNMNELTEKLKESLSKVVNKNLAGTKYDSNKEYVELCEHVNRYVNINNKNI